MVLRLDDRWVWDSWYVRDGGRWHAFFLQAPRSIEEPELRHWHVSQGHAVSDDLVDWRYLGTSFGPAPRGAWDDYTTWTGSVVKGPDGLWHLFYTGTCHAEDGLIQRIGHATSTDLNTFERVGDGLCLDLAGDDYEQFRPGFWHDRAMRDPWVMPDPEGAGWLMYFTARSSGIAEPNAGGAIGFATSPDLVTWTLQPPVFIGGFGQLEVPQVFAWSIAPGPFLDGALPCRRYAARIVETGDGLRIIGFMDRPDGDFVGELTDPDPVEVMADGRLRVTPHPRAE
jgi:beta-fructofuranosidase